MFDVNSVNLVVLLLSLCLLGGNLLHRMKFSYLPESGLSIILGVLFGTSIYYVTPNAAPLLYFDDSLFFLILLPPIIFEAGLSISKKIFKANLFTCLFFAIGTYV